MAEARRLVDLMVDGVRERGIAPTEIITVTQKHQQFTGAPVRTYYRRSGVRGWLLCEPRGSYDSDSDSGSTWTNGLIATTAGQVVSGTVAVGGAPTQGRFRRAPSNGPYLQVWGRELRYMDLEHVGRALTEELLVVAFAGLAARGAAWGRPGLHGF
ncbi:hypothetical protein FHU33_1563 [Blastococcus colisei]|uniref:Uncharacterized protein n=1 Tax=Blastococcus colisei TaxID=1564162 RepID=A0A543PDN9_9ACTN|nr:hypothetical protein FHU33_1563 [Blastococcus colisei]